MKLKFKSKFQGLLTKNWLVLVLFLFFLLRLPSLFEPFTYGDEGIYLTLGQAARKGLVWYRDIHDNKPPMLYLMAALANNFTIYRLIHFAWSLVTILAFWQLAKLLFIKNRLATAVSTVGFTLLTGLHSFEGNVANAENFMLLPTIAGFYLIYEALIKPPQKKLQLAKSFFGWFLAGVLFSIATLFKLPAVFDFGAILVFSFFVLLSVKKKNYWAWLASYGFSFLGFFLPIFLTVLYYTAKGALGPYLTAAFLQNLPYLSSWAQDAPQTGGLPLFLLLRGLLLGGLIIGLFLFKKHSLLVTKLILIWFGFAWFAALLSARPYPHYLIQILPALALCLGIFFLRRKKHPYEFFVPLVLVIIFRLTFLIFHFWQYPDLAYYQNFYQYALGFKNQQEYFRDFDPKAESIYQAAAWLKDRTLPEEKIFIWGTQPSIYALSQRLPVGRYTTSYHVIDFNGYQETLAAIEKNPPCYLLITGEEKRPFPELSNLILTGYAREKQFGQIQILHRLAKKTQ